MLFIDKIFRESTVDIFHFCQYSNYYGLHYLQERLLSSRFRNNYALLLRPQLKGSVCATKYSKNSREIHLIRDKSFRCGIWVSGSSLLLLIYLS